MVNLSNLRQNKQDQQGTAGLDSSEVSALSGGGVEVFDTIDSLPSIGIGAGDKALVNSVNRLYVSDGSGWYNLDLNTGFTPRWDSGGEPDATYSIADSQTPLIVTARAVDSDGTTPINQSFVSDSAQYMATISNDSSVWTFTPKTKVQIGTAVAAGNLTDSNGDFIYTFKWSDGINVLSKAVTISYSPSGSADYIGTRAFSQGGRIGSNSNYYSSNLTGAGYNNIVHLDIVTRSNTTRVENVFSYASTMGKQATGVRGATVLSVGGNDTGNQRVEEMFTFNSATLGAAQSHGSLTGVLTDGEDPWMNAGSLSDGDRCVAVATRDYQTSSTKGTILYASIQNTGDASDFGDLTQNRIEPSSTNDDTRGLFIGGDTGTGQISRIDYFTIQTADNAGDFGDLTSGTRYHRSCTDKSVALVTGGRNSGSVYITGCQYFTIQTLGNAASFGNLQNARHSHCLSSDGTTAVTWGGRGFGTPPFPTVYEYQTIATAGNATEFGEEADHVTYEGGHGSGAAA